MLATGCSDHAIMQQVLGVIDPVRRAGALLRIEALSTEDTAACKAVDKWIASSCGRASDSKWLAIPALARELMAELLPGGGIAGQMQAGLVVFPTGSAVRCEDARAGELKAAGIPVDAGRGGRLPGLTPLINLLREAFDATVLFDSSQVRAYFPAPKQLSHIVGRAVEQACAGEACAA